MRQTLRIAATVLTVVIGLSDQASSTKPWQTLTGDRPIVIAHRGASGYLPEHTLEGYKLASEMGADFIEPDLVATKDEVLIARHEPMLGDSTDVAERPEFASRRTQRNVDGIEVNDWFAGDFTLAEIKQLRAKQVFAERDQSMNGKYQIPTLEEIIDLVKAEALRHGRTIGIYPETKHPTFHRAMGLSLEDLLLGSLQRAGWTDETSPVIIQSFEVATLKYLRTKTQVRLVQLIGAGAVDKNGTLVLSAPYAQPYDFVVTGDHRTFKDLVTKAGLAEIAGYANGVAPWKPYILATRQVDKDGDGTPDDLNGDGVMDERDRVLTAPSDLVSKAHAAGLFVHTWTFRNEAHRLASDFNGEPANEYKVYLALAIDGVFSDFPDTAVSAR